MKEYIHIPPIRFYIIHVQICAHVLPLDLDMFLLFKHVSSPSCPNALPGQHNVLKQSFCFLCFWQLVPCHTIHLGFYDLIYLVLLELLSKRNRGDLVISERPHLSMILSVGSSQL